jgi:outer membrane protein assembly factor BamB
METSKRIVAIITLVLALLMFSLPFIGFSNSTPITANVQQHVDPVTGQPYGNLLQYEWTSLGGNSENTRYSAGPAPNRPDVLWTFDRPDGNPLTGAPITAFDGKVFTYGTQGGAMLYAVDPFDGSMIYEAPMNGTPIGFGTGSIFKVDDTYMGYITSNGIAFYETDTGDFVSRLILTSADGIDGGNLIAGQVLYWGGFWDYDNKMAYVAGRNVTTNQHMAIGLDCSNPAAGAEIAWTWGAPTGIEALGSGGGLAFFGGYGEGELYAINAITGDLVWRQWKKGNTGYSVNYYDGKVYHAASSTRVTCWDATDGTILWDFDAGERSFFAYGGAVAYGLYFDKCMHLPGYVAAWDAESGDILWKQPAHYTITYASPAVADGKLFVSTSDQGEGASVAGMVSPGYSTTCFDVFTGEVIWKIPINLATPAIAYGNLYHRIGGTLYCIGENTDPWPRYGGNLGDDGVAVGQYVPSELSDPKWTYETEGPVTGSPVAADGKVVFGSYDKHIYCLDAETGAFNWKFPTGYRVSSTPTLVDGVVYTGADDGYIYAIDADDGTELWNRYAGGLQADTLWASMVQKRSSPTVVNDLLYVGAMDGNFYCLDTADGTVEWTYPISDIASGVGGTPVVSEGVVYIASGDGRLYAFDAVAGTQKWNTTLTTANRYMSGTPTVIEELGMIVSYAHAGGFFMGQRLEGHNITDGSLLWRVDLSLFGFSTSPAIYSPTYINNGTHDLLYLSEGMFAAQWVIVNSTYVERSWGTWTGRQVYTPLIYADSIDGGKLYFGTDVYSCEVLDADDGSTISAYTTGGQVYGPPAIYEGRLYFGSYDFNLYCFEDTHEVYTDIWAVSSKGAKMLPNETVVISGGLRAPMTYTDERVPTLREEYYPPIANAEIKASLTKPDGTDVPLTTTTDNDGLFSFPYTPTETGEWGWVVYYEGKELAYASYSQAYSSWNVLEVISPEEPNGNGGVQPPPEEGIPIEYIYAIVAVVAIVIIAIVGYLYMRSRKK